MIQDSVRTFHHGTYFPQPMLRPGIPGNATEEPAKAFPSRFLRVGPKAVLYVVSTIVSEPDFS
jgi:hypothetical protein